MKLRSAVFVYLALSLFFLYLRRFEIALDTVSYIDIARKYASGDFLPAINGTFSPLFSILLAPAVWLNLNLLISSKVVLIFSGLALIFLAGKIFSLKYFPTRYKKIALAVIFFQTLFYVFFTTTPDIILTAFLTAYLLILLNNSYIGNLKLAALAGFLASLAFFAKTYALTFFIVHFTLIHLLFVFYHRPKLIQVFKQFVIGMVVFLLASSPWIALLSYKYGYFTFGTVARYNMAIFGPQSQGQPFDQYKLVEPSNKTATSSWEDPSLQRTNDWNPLSSLKDIKYQFFILRNNLWASLIFFEKASFLSLPILVIAFLLLRVKKTDKFFISFCLVTTFVYTLGYCLISVEIRYLYPAFVVLVALGVYELFILKNQKIFKRQSSLLVAIFIISFSWYPLWYLLSHAYESKEYHDQASILKQLGIKNTNIATNKYGRKTLYLAYYTHSKFYGQTGNYQNTPELISNLKEFEVEYYFLWKDDQFLEMSTNLASFLPEVSQDKTPGMKIYSLKSKKY